MPNEIYREPMSPIGYNQGKFFQENIQELTNQGGNWSKVTSQISINKKIIPRPKYKWQWKTKTISHNNIYNNPTIGQGDTQSILEVNPLNSCQWRHQIQTQHINMWEQLMRIRPAIQRSRPRYTQTNKQINGLTVKNVESQWSTSKNEVIKTISKLRCTGI